MSDSYSFIDLNNNEKLVKEIRDLETEISDKTGEKVILLAYTKRDNYKSMD